ncbi:MAG: hypothetical protein Q9186_002525 [Xanthomendoza sp. 1 TL-2023]
MEQLAHRSAVETSQALKLLSETRLQSPLVDTDIDAITDRGNEVSADVQSRSATSDLSLDDLEAAQALEGLRADCGRPPRIHRRDHAVDSKTDPTFHSPSTSQQTQDPEPLLSLLTSQHPLLSTAINGSLSAYTSSKTYSPRFKYGAELVERHVGSPVVSTVCTAGRYTGLETSVRWFLDGERRGRQPRASKRRRTEYGEAGAPDVEQGLHPGRSHRRDSRTSLPESLPPYDDERSPTYEQHDSSSHPTHDTTSNTTWRSRLMISTSGLGVAMSEKSLQSLKHCLAWLRWGNHQLTRATTDLSEVIKTHYPSHQDKSIPAGSGDDGKRQQSSEPRDRAAISRHIQALNSNIRETLSKVVNVVSEYTGGALPENARRLVYTHLSTFPHRVTRAYWTSGQQTEAPSTQEKPSDDAQNGPSASEPEAEPEITMAQRALVMAAEGLDMLAQIAGIVDGTITSAEEWCNRLGRHPRGSTTTPGDQANPQQHHRDEKKAVEHIVSNDRTNGEDEKTRR